MKLGRREERMKQRETGRGKERKGKRGKGRIELINKNEFLSRIY